MSSPRRPRVVALGGGHGLYAMLQALVGLDVDITAVVTVADDGGSSGRLRREVPGILPPGDLRMALSALSRDDGAGPLWSSTFQHRFGGQGALAGHPVGNLLLVGLTQVTGDPVAALDAAGDMLGARGRVLPMSTIPLDIAAEVEGLDEDPTALRRIRGQVAVASTPGRVRSVSLEPADAPACPQALAAIAGADLVTLGPGSWFTSVLVHLLLPELAAALQSTTAHRLLALNLVAQPGETDGFSPEQHLDVLAAHAPGLRLDTVLADRGAVSLPGRLSRAAERLGARVVLDDIAVPGEDRHDTRALSRSLDRILSRGPVSASGSAPPDAGPSRPGTPPGRTPADAGDRVRTAETDGPTGIGPAVGVREGARWR
ncbi:putative cofD-like protein [Nakamurella flavida]|nr:uridine diphosphate-N-acetylglucosamine-binding protein YvcK [Nakamurella flavida]MDP9776839.1 putative cofD-like protein [Nakamurella flavida]